ncbi:MAG: histone-like nucleoid-structuring protein Lsr2 [Nocardioidaceae bacterium]
MAQKVQVLLVDDLDGGEAAETVEFGLDGTSYEIDLSSENAAKLRETLAGYLAEARRRGSSRRSGRASSGRGRGRSGGTAAAEIRGWARANGWDVPERGRVSSEVRKAYDAAH